MHKEQVSDKEAICLIALFVMGSTLIMGIGGKAKNSAWASVLIGILLAVPIILLYARVLFIFPGKDLFEILSLLFGKIVGKFVSVLYIWYAFHLGAMVLRNFGEFVDTLTMPETPMIAIILFLGFVCIVAVRLGVEVMGRICAYLFPITLVIVLLIQMLAVSEFRFNYLRPILSYGILPIIEGGLSAFTFPFAETVLFLGVLFSLKDKKSTRKVFLYGLSISGFIIVLLTLRNILVLGPMLESLYFPSYNAVSHINIGEFLQRMEVTVAFVFAVGAFVKISVCLFVSCKGVSRLFNLKDYRSITIQTGLLMAFLSYFIYDNITEMIDWVKIYPYYALPFQVIIPIVIWIFAEVKKKKVLT